MNQTPTRASTFMARLLAMKSNPANRQQQVNAKPAKRPAPPPLVDQIREVLAGWPESQRRKIHAPTLLPALKGRYRENPSLRAVGKALRLMGYEKSARVWGKDDPDFGRRFWVLGEAN